MFIHFFSHLRHSTFLSLALVCTIVTSLYSKPLVFDIKGDAAILINADTGAVLFEKNSQKSLFPASTTKIATALYALSLLGDNLNATVVAEPESLKTVTDVYKKKLNYQLPGYWLEPDGTHIRLRVNEELSYQSLIEGMLIASGNDAANVIAQGLGPTIPVFMTNLNQFLKELGCLNTTYHNPHGLHHPEHVTTAYDLARMSSVALKNPAFCQVVKKTNYRRPQTNLQEPDVFAQGNRLVRSGSLHYSPAIGIKTGYHSKAKKTFVGAAQVGNRTLIVALLGYQGRNVIFEEAKNLFELAFNEPQVEKTFVKSGSQEFHLALPRAKTELRTYTNEDLYLSYFPAEELPVKCYLNWDELTLPVKQGQRVGELYLKDTNDQILNQVDLLALNSVEYGWPFNWLANLKNFYSNHPYITLLYAFIFLICGMGTFWIISQKREK